MILAQATGATKQGSDRFQCAPASRLVHTVLSFETTQRRIIRIQAGGQQVVVDQVAVQQLCRLK